MTFIFDTTKIMFQFTHPGKGATCTSPMRVSPRECFNSRTLGRVRLSASSHRAAPLEVSIHAPWEGCDFPPLRPPGASRRFQFTHPGKGATEEVAPLRAFFLSFNSRTLGRVRLHRHASTRHCARFNSRTLGRVRPRRRRQGGRGCRVSIHAPWEGCDRSYSGTRQTATVSIHAPWEGCDIELLERCRGI